MSPQLAQSEPTEIMRPLKVLVPLIKKDLEQGDEAAQQAGMPYYQAAGEKMIEAKPQVSGGFEAWVKRTFNISPTQARRYMSIARTTSSKQNGRARTFESLREHDRHTGRDSRPTGGAVRRDWTAPVDDIAERTRREMERIRDAELTRQQEREADHKLALRLIEIGFKVLAKELHPDKGGSRDAMTRLNRVRDRLKIHA
jgi:hypothetical protein